MSKRTFLTAEVMGRDCTNRGATSGQDQVRVEAHRGNWLFEESAGPLLGFIDADPEISGPGYEIVKKAARPANLSMDIGYRGARTLVRARAVPLDEDGEPRVGGMFGGHFVWSSDSRFPYASPVPVFDRFE